MKVGLTMDMRNVTGRPWREYWEDYLWFICEAESMGFDYVGIQEHFFTDDGYGPSIPIFITMLAERRQFAWAHISTCCRYIMPQRWPKRQRFSTIFRMVGLR
jgi:hypothetical protein